MSIQIPKTLLYLFLSIIMSHNAYAQKHIKDSIRSQLYHAFNIVRQGEVGKSREITYWALDEAKKINDKDLIGYSYIVLGVTYAYLEENEEAINNYKKALEYYTALKDTTNITGILNNIGHAHRLLKQPEKAQNYFEEALKVTKNDTIKALLFSNLGSIYYDEENYLKARDLFKRALTYHTKNKDSVNMATSLEKLTYAYAKLNDTILEKEFLHKAYLFANKFELLHIKLGLLQHQHNKIKKDYNPEIFATQDSIITTIEKMVEKEKFDIAKDIESKYKLNETNEKLTLIKKEQGTQKKLNIVLILLTTFLVISLIGIFLNVKKEKKLNSKLRQANKKIKQQLIKIQTAENQLQVLEDDITSEIHDKFGNSLSNLRSSHEILKELIDDKDFTSPKFNNFSANIDKELHVISEELTDFIWINKNKDSTLKQIIDNVKILCNKKSELHNITIETNFYLHDENYQLPKHWNRQFFTLIKNLINNAIKYSNPSIIQLAVKVNNGIYIKCSDDGIKIKDGIELKSIYFKNIRKVVESIGHTLKYTYDLEKKNTITIEGEVPINHKTHLEYSN